MAPVFDGNKCKVHLKMLINRFKLLEAKKANLNKQANRAVAQLLREGKSESARIAVEHSIREDFTIEVYEILRQHIELLLARWAVVQNESEPRKEVQESVCTVIYAGYLLSAEIVELKVLYEQLTVRYGKPFAAEVTRNPTPYISPKVLYKLQYGIPDPALVQTYLIEIARAHHVDWAPVPVPTAMTLADLGAPAAAPPPAAPPPPDRLPVVVGIPIASAVVGIPVGIPVVPAAHVVGVLSSAPAPEKGVEPVAPAPPRPSSPAASAPPAPAPAPKPDIDDELALRLAALKGR